MGVYESLPRKQPTLVDLYTGQLVGGVGGIAVFSLSLEQVEPLLVSARCVCACVREGRGEVLAYLSLIQYTITSMYMGGGYG